MRNIIKKAPLFTIGAVAVPVAVAAMWICYYSAKELPYHINRI